MPKKYHQKSLLTKPTSGAPSSLSLSRSTPDNHVQQERTVNELIRESRESQGNSQQPRNVQISSSIPPTLRAVLDMPAPAPPPPRYGMRGPSRLRRVPGPPPPRSWTDSKSVSSSPELYNGRTNDTRTRIYPHSSNLPGAIFPNPNSLQHTLLKSMATNWQWHIEFDHEYLAELPVRMKEVLLSYIAIYGEGHGQNSLQLLFPVDIDQGECDEVRRLDLGNAVGWWSTIKRIEKELSTIKKAVVHQVIELSRTPEAWDDEDSTEVLSTSSPTAGLNRLRFENLKHLSLAAAPNTIGAIVSWHDLLGLAGKLKTLTSLSLAHWPQPTYTPNASTGRYKINATNGGSSPAVLYGGTNFYSAFDNDWREAAGILRSLSRSLYCLKWLDLTGCGEWFPALIWRPEDEDTEFTSPGPDWNGSWRGLEHLILAVGWTPGRATRSHHTVDVQHIIKDAGRLDGRYGHASEHIAEMLSQLSTLRLGDRQASAEASQKTWNIEDERTEYFHRKEIEKYMELSNCARKVAQHLRSLRKEVGGRWIDVDLGHKEEFEDAS